MYRLTAGSILLLIGLASDAHALLCARGNGTVASRPVCKRHEQEVSIAALLPTRPAALFAERDGPVTLTLEGAKVGALTLPTGERESTRNYGVLATVALENHAASAADTASCALILQAPGRSDPFGLRLAGFSALLVEAGTSASMTLLGGLPNLDPSTLQNGSGAVALWCFSSAPGSNFSAATASLVAIPVDQVQTQ